MLYGPIQAGNVVQQWTEVRFESEMSLLQTALSALDWAADEAGDSDSATMPCDGEKHGDAGQRSNPKRAIIGDVGG